MFYKPYTICVLLLFLAIVPAHAALDCTVVAQIRTAAIDEVGILRAERGDKHEWASRHNRDLCAGDVVIVPKSIQRLTISYYSEIPKKKTLMAGDRYRVEALVEPSAWRKLMTSIGRLYDKLTSTEPSEMSLSESAAARGHGESGPLPIFTPLAAGEGADYPFYLVARAGAIPLFWYGGQPPYRVVVKNAAGQEVVRETVNTASFSLNLADTQPGSVYTLTVQSTVDKSCQKNNSKLCQKELIFAVPPFPVDPKIDPEIMSAALLADCDNNWRLEVWRQLSALPDSQKKRRFMKRLEIDDIEPDDEDWCQ